MYISNFIVNQTSSIMNKSFFKVKKNMWFRVVAMVVTQELVRVWSFNSLWRCSPFFIRLDILTNFVGNKKNCFLPKILSTKPSLTNWLDESLQCCCHTIISCSHLKLFWLLAMFTLLYSPWDLYKLCWK